MDLIPAHSLILGTRGSELALAQTEIVTRLITAKHPGLKVARKIIATAGDKRPDLRFKDFAKGDNAVLDKGIFIKELEIALENGDIDAAVHSLKDVPSDLSRRFTLAAFLEREAVEDVLVTHEAHTLESLPLGARVGTSSVRRARQLKWLRPDIEIVEIRGNVGTRVKKVLGEAPLDAVMLAAAGLIRLGMLDATRTRIEIEGRTVHAAVLDAQTFLPASGQGAITLETRARDYGTASLLSAINHFETHARVSAEREFLRALNAGCDTPIGARTWIANERMHMAVRVFDEHRLTAPPFEAVGESSIHTPKALATDLANRVLSQA